MRVSLESAFLIHSRPYRETSVIAEWFTRNQGRITSVVRGVRKKSKSATHLLPFCEYQISWYGRGDMVTTTGWDLVNNIWLTGDQLTVGLYVNELIMRLFTPGDAHPAFFSHYQLMLQALYAQANMQPLIRKFELLLLKELGYEVVLDREATSGELIQADRVYHFNANIGFTVAVDAGNKSNYPGSVLIKLSENDSLNREEMRFARRLTREALAPHVGTKPLNSRGLLYAGAVTRNAGESFHEESER